MKTILALLCLISLSAWGQPFQRQFFTTNTAPVVDVVAGSNATVQASTPNAQTRRFTVNAIPSAGGAQTNISVVAAGTNILVTVASSNGTNTYTVYGVTDTNVVNILAAIKAADATNGVAIASSNLFLLKSGDTAAGALLTTSSTTNAPANNELVTGGWVRGLFNNGVLDYATTNITTGTNAGSPNQVLYEFWTGVIPQPSVRTWVTAWLTNNGYVGSVVTTNTFMFAQGPIVVNSYLGMTGGGASALAIHPEIYYSYDKTNWYGDWEAQGQSLVNNTTNLHQWVVSIPAITATNSSGFYLQRRFKVNSVNSTPTLYFLVGTNTASGPNDASHISFSGPNSQYGNAYLAANQIFTGSNQFSGGVMFWGDGIKTNGVYIGPAGEVLSNALGSVTISGGNITATGVVKDSASYPPFDLNINATGTNIYITPTNGNLQRYTMTNTAFFTLLSGNTNNTETIRVEVYGSNTLTWATADLSNSASLYLTNYTSVFLLDREAFTNLFWGYRLR